MLASIKRALCFFAHPDDETLAAGGTIHRLAQTATIYAAIPSAGVMSRPGAKKSDVAKLTDQCLRATGILGIHPSNVILGDFADNEIDGTTRLTLIKWLESIIEKVHPDLVITHHRYCTNIDHQYCHEAAVVACRPSPTRKVTLWAGEVLSSTGYLRPAQWEPNLYIDISTADLKAKLSAMTAYASEMRPTPHARSLAAIKALAILRGSERNSEYAEAFVIQRAYL